ncbi:hypothetical protein DAI22_04g172600 [Oryza sativa Japonica Group]|nr:hypothetical protein DAI22_04g172600 [Oryza sativa Japonica Group]
MVYLAGKVSQDGRRKGRERPFQGTIIAVNELLPFEGAKLF